MALDLWFKDQLKRTIDSKAQAVARLPVNDYRLGYEDALDDFRKEFGLDDIDARLAHWQVVNAVPIEGR
ncbi:MAG: hypothetical protein ABFD92_21055 [Planctomycetaceae bacterium]